MVINPSSTDLSCSLQIRPQVGRGFWHRGQLWPAALWEPHVCWWESALSPRAPVPRGHGEPDKQSRDRAAFPHSCQERGNQTGTRTGWRVESTQDSTDGRSDRCVCVRMCVRVRVQRHMNTGCLLKSRLTAALSGKQQLPHRALPRAPALARPALRSLRRTLVPRGDQRQPLLHLFHGGGGRGQRKNLRQVEEGPCAQHGGGHAWEGAPSGRGPTLYHEC